MLLIFEMRFVMSDNKNKKTKSEKDTFSKEERKQQAKDSYKKLVERNGPALKRLSDS